MKVIEMKFRKETRLRHPVKDVFDWHERPGALERLSPPWDGVRLINAKGGIKDGARVEIEVPVGPFRQRWIAEHFNYEYGKQFNDRLVKSPFKNWEHRHIFEVIDEQTTLLVDDIDLKLPVSPISDALAGWHVRSRVERTFAYRHRVTKMDLRAHATVGLSPKRILISGGTGLVGSQLKAFLTTGGHDVTILSSSRKSGDGVIRWDVEKGIDGGDAALEGFDVIVHLAGVNIAAKKRWNDAHKQAVTGSRVKGTTLLAETISRLKVKPGLFLCASATGFYGDRGKEELTEDSEQGENWLAKTTKDWEDAAEAARQAGVRVVNARLGVVLSPAGGALKEMLPAFTFGAGGRLGSGKFYMPWIALDDVLYAFLFLMGNQELSGPVNVVAPTQSTNAEFTKILNKVLRRPGAPPVPKFVLKLMFPGMAEEALLASQRVKPAKLNAAGHDFRFGNLEAAFRHVLGRTRES